MSAFKSMDREALVAHSHDDNAIVERDEEIEKLWSEMALVHEVDFKGIVSCVFGTGATQAATSVFRRNDNSIDRACWDVRLEAVCSFNCEGSFRSQGGKLAVVCLPGALVICGLLASTWRSASVSFDTSTGIYQSRVLISSLLVTAGGVLVSSILLWSLGSLVESWRSFRAGLEPAVVLGMVTLIAASASAIYGVLGASDSILDDKFAKAALVKVAIESLDRPGVTGTCSAFQDGKQSGEITIKSDYCTKDFARYTASAKDEQTVIPMDKWVAEVSPDAAKISWSRKPTFAEKWIVGSAPTVWSVVLGQAVKVDQNIVDVKVRTGDVRRYNIASKPDIVVGSQVVVEKADSKSAPATIWQLSSARFH